MDAGEYRDCLIGIWPDEIPGFFRAKALEEFGRSAGPVRVHLPFDDRWFVQYVERLETLNFRELHYVGARLFDAVFQGDILRLYVHILEQTRPSGQKLRLRLKLEPPMVARLPWECLYDTRNATFLSSSEYVSLVRYQSPTRSEPPVVALRPPIRTLIATESVNQGLSHVGQEALALYKVMQELSAEGLVQVDCLGDVFGEPLTAEGLERAFWQNYDVVHLVTEAIWNGSEAYFQLRDETISAQEFAAKLGPNAPRLVVWSGSGENLAVGPALSDALIDLCPALVTQRLLLRDEFTSRFSRAFYRALAEFQSIDSALASARRDVLPQSLETEWLSPSLFVSRKDVTIFANQGKTSATDVLQMSEGRYRRNIRETLNRIWPKPERYAEQALHWLPRDEPLNSYMHAAEDLSRAQPASELVKRFQRMLLLGESGCGKSMTLFRLFYEAAQPILSYEAKSPLPVYVSMPDIPEEQGLYEHLAERFDSELLESDLEEGRFLFLVDALDGLSTSGAIRRADLLNDFMARYSMNRFVVAARRPLPRPLDISNWVEMAAFTEDEAIDFLVSDGTVRSEPARLLVQQLATHLGKAYGNPQVLAMAKRLWREGARVPETLTGMFTAFFDVAGDSLAPEMREGLLPQLAYFMTKGDRVALVREHLLKQQEEPRGLSGLAVELAFQKAVGRTPEELLKEVDKTRLLRGPGAFVFPNISFQEFLTALAMCDMEPHRILQLVSPADWREFEDIDSRPQNLSRGPYHGVLPFLSGLHDQAPILVQRLIESDLVLATKCLVQIGPSVQSELVDLVQATIEFELASSDSLRRRVACLALEAYGNRWATGWLERLASTEDHSARALALEALGRLGDQASVPILESAARAVNPNVSRAASHALLRLGRTG